MPTIGWKIIVTPSHWLRALVTYSYWMKKIQLPRADMLGSGSGRGSSPSTQPNATQHRLPAHQMIIRRCDASGIRHTAGKPISWQTAGKSVQAVGLAEGEREGVRGAESQPALQARPGAARVHGAGPWPWPQSTQKRSVTQCGPCFEPRGFRKTPRSRAGLFKPWCSLTSCGPMIFFLGTVPRV